MKVEFFDRTSDALSNYAKGTLFEQFLKRLLMAAGYLNVTLRKKHASLEYDVEAVHGIMSRKVIGEAKAHAATIPSGDVTGFVGKLLPLAAREHIDGLFFSISPLTADGHDYLSSIESSKNALPSNLTFQTITGEDVYRCLVDQRGYPSEEALREKILCEYGLLAFDGWLVVSNDHDFIVFICGPNAVALATHYAVFDKNGTPINIGPEDSQRLSAQLSDLDGLIALPASGPIATSKFVERKLPGIAPGAGWFDYRFPASPAAFIGRDDAIAVVRASLDAMSAAATSVRVLQILSRSGVGKSSLLLKVEGAFPDHIFLTTDARSLRVPSDLRLLINQAVDIVNSSVGGDVDLAKSRDEAPAALASLNLSLAGRSSVLVVQLDQFESVLTLPDLFQALLDLMLATTANDSRIIWILARKNDLAATFDESSQIDLERLNQISQIIKLNDFNIEEGRQLLTHLREELGKRPTKDLEDAVSTFSAGFPWLLKRLCAHVLSMNAAGVSFREMVQGGLRAEDLFEEDLAVLSEPDRALIRKLAAHMPNTAVELSRRLESEIAPQRLMEKLNELLGTKLIRLSGDIYDTYNDVFKTYLVTGRVPFSPRYLFRVTPKATVELLYRIKELGPMELHLFQQAAGGNKVAVINKLRELRLLGLIDSQPGRVSISAAGLSAIETGTVSDFLRRALRANGLIVDVLDSLTARDTLSIAEVVTILRDALPGLNVTDRTWSHYAKLVAAWLRFAGLIHQEGETIRPTQAPGDELQQSRVSRGTFSADTFLPSVRPNVVVALIELLRPGAQLLSRLYEEFGTRDTAGLLRDVQQLELVEIEGDAISLTRTGRSLVEGGSLVTNRDVAVLTLSKKNVKALLDAAAAGTLSEPQQKEILSKFGAAQWTPMTWRWRLGRLRSWLAATGHVRQTKAGLRAIDTRGDLESQRSLFDNVDK